MASTFRSATRSCRLKHFSLASRVSNTAPVCATRGVLQRHSPASPQSLVNTCRSKPFSTTTISRQATAQPSTTTAAETAEAEEDRLDIPVFQFKDIRPDGSLPPTKSLKVNIDGQPFTFDNVFLRDSCTCHTCVDPSTQQKLFTTSDIDLEIHPRRARIANGLLKIEWSHKLEKSAVPEAEAASGLHWSHYDVDFLKQSSTPIQAIKKTMTDFRRIIWDKKIMTREVLWVDYKDYMTDDLALAKALKHLSLYGLIFIKGVPDGRTVDQVPSLAERIGNLKRTFYGDTWMVKSLPGSKNIAYTSLDLGLHMDLLYFESPPGLQFLHCVENSVTGGESYFVDGFNGATALRHFSRVSYDVLTKYPVNFHYHNDGKHYRFSRPIIVPKTANETYHDTGIDHMNWAPPFQAPFTMDHNGKMIASSPQWRQFVKGMAELNKSFENPMNQYELLLKEGECVVFFNRRVLHARRGFDAESGHRRLTGGYVDIDAFESACRVLAERYPEQSWRKGKDEKQDGYEYLGQYGYDHWT